MSLLRLRSPDGRWAFRVVEGQAATLGRAPTAALRVQDVSVARTHARIADRGGRWYVQDLRSRNGVVVNGLQIEDESELRAGDTLRLGQVELEVDVTAAADTGAS